MELLSSADSPMLHRIHKQISAFFTVSALVSTIPISSAFFVTPTQSWINRVFSTRTSSSNKAPLLLKSTKYQTKPNQIPETSQLAKSNKQARLAESTQRVVVPIIAGCTAKVYWYDNRKTYTVTAGACGYFVSSNGYIVTNAHVQAGITIAILFDLQTPDTRLLQGDGFQQICVWISFTIAITRKKSSAKDTNI